ncbi:hypothetical protein Ahy_A02g007062 isoform A [Arachis hypogaea]|uniref:2-(3-amino-3-carboxypropyl)histidine synthase subunit 1 n=1 Tax=Arachis hypogaea TaxID=3818 RepID=A0A445EBZ2_ARAHY|nr:hypothetical protein Ahy_A02g007062 isoform A [Arachis hypogaea]
MSEISPARIALFEDSVDACIQVACPRLSFDWGDAFGKPVLNPFESDFGGEYLMDYYSQDGEEWNFSYVKKSSRPVTRISVSSGVYGHGGEGNEDVGERKGVHEEALGELKGNALGGGGKNVPNAFVDLEVVVLMENGDGIIEGRGKTAGDVTYCAFCIDDFSVATLSIDLLIHYGHSCLVPIDSTTIPYLYVFVDIKIDFSHFVDTFIYVIRAAKPELEKSEFRVLVPQSKPLSAGEFLGCTAPKVSLMDSFSENPENSILVFVADGRFHLEAIMIANPGIKLFLEEYDHVGMKESRKCAILRAREEARNWSVILWSLGRQGNPNILERLEKNMKEKGYRLIGVMLFGKPVLNPFEAEITLGVIPGWWEKKKNVLAAKVEKGCEDGGVSCQKSGDSSCECCCGEDEN